MPAALRDDFIGRDEYERLCEAAEEGERLEYIDGQVVRMLVGGSIAHHALTRCLDNLIADRLPPAGRARHYVRRCGSKRERHASTRMSSSPAGIPSNRIRRPTASVRRPSSWRFCPPRPNGTTAAGNGSNTRRCTTSCISSMSRRTNAGSDSSTVRETDGTTNSYKDRTPSFG
ncbi:Uma2 family endonuclease [Methylobacterium sp. NFXW15]